MPRAEECRAFAAGKVQCIALYGSGKTGSSRYNTNGISHLCNCKGNRVRTHKAWGCQKGKQLPHPAQVQPS